MLLKQHQVRLIAHAKRTLVLAAALMSSFLIAPLSAQRMPPEGLLTKLTVCNKTKADLSIILFHRHIWDESKWMLSGWFNVSVNACTHVKSIPKGYYYFHAVQSNTSVAWGGTDRFLCISQRPVERVVFPSERCLVGERNIGFSERHAPDAETSLNLTQN